MLMLVALWLGRGGAAQATRRIPLRLNWFITGFLALAAINSLVPIPASAPHAANGAAQGLLLLAIVATAMTERHALLLDQGWRRSATILVETVTSFRLSFNRAAHRCVG